MTEGNKLSRTVLRGEGGEIPLTYPVAQAEIKITTQRNNNEIDTKYSFSVF